MFNELKVGIDCITEGFALARRPVLRPYMVVPVLVNIILFGVSGYLVISYFYEWLSGWSGTIDLWSWLDWLESFVNSLIGALKWVIFLAVISLLLFFMGSTFTMITHLLISPFIGILGEKAELQLHTPSYPQHSLGQIALRTVGREIRKLVYWLWRTLGLAVLSLVLYFVPGFNLLVPVIWFMFGAWILAMQYIDVAADNNGRSFDELLLLMAKNRVAVMAFGSVVMLLTSIPIVNLIIVPVAVCSGVVFWVKKINPDGTVTVR